MANYGGYDEFSAQMEVAARIHEAELRAALEGRDAPFHDRRVARRLRDPDYAAEFDRASRELARRHPVARLSQIFSTRGVDRPIPSPLRVKPQSKEGN